MDIEAAITLVDREVYRCTNKHLNDLQQAIVIKVWQGRKYVEIADEYGCTEGHAKDTGSLLWKLLSSAWDKKVTKGNFRTLIKRQLKTLPRLEAGSNKDNARQDGSQTIDNPNFVGRQEAIATLQNLVDRGNKIIVLQAKGGVGKTTLAQQFLSDRGFENTLEVLMAKETSNIVPAAAVVEEWLQRDLNQDSGKEFGITLARLKRYLEQHRVGILIDNLEPALDRDGKFIAVNRNYIELLRILADPKVQSVTIITSRDRLCEAEVDLTHYRLPGLDFKAWQQYFAVRQIEHNSIKQIHHTYGGNAKAMGIVCGIIREDYAGDVRQYWQENQRDPLVETDLKNLVASQFERIKKLDERAYVLLCRLGCYRYQDWVQVDRAGLLCLLWDVKTGKQRVIKSLLNRSLLESDRGRYWLHPIVQAEAKLRLQSLPDRERSHRQIAEFLTDSIVKIDSIQDGLTALEAYYHYVTIHDYVAAAKVILYSRENQWGQFLTLGTTLYRLGIIQPLESAIDRVIDRIEHDRYRSELNNILGDLYWTTGKVHQGIVCQRKTIAMSRHYGDRTIPETQENRHDLYYWRMLEVDSLLSLGLYYIDLGELEEAANLFQQVINLAHNTKHNSWSEKASIALALVNSFIDTSISLDPIIPRLYGLIIDLEDCFYNTGRFAYFMQMLGQIFFNHRQIEPAKTIWQRAIAFARSGHYTQIEAKSLVGLGNIERLAHNFEMAQAYHQQAVKSLEAITAKCDLAQAYFQWGITLQKSDRIAEGKDCLNKAIALYREIVAPKQIAKIEFFLTDF